MVSDVTQNGNRELEFPPGGHEWASRNSLCFYTFCRDVSDGLLDPMSADRRQSYLHNCPRNGQLVSGSNVVAF
ncbi:hypothetical protein EMPG_13547 [Blastomyces silverae]|uniref:Uncharacterized protein n=1 Tax=Blastomyces silverae TaxID=2060906 RepID=A0A0H1BI16_9EURO|nr:hypothetical protein EMPG_13547 [Blastomyces silverae]